MAYPGTAMSNTLIDVQPSRLIELPVAEEMGMSLGLALDGKVPISIFPRWNFLLCAINQLVNHIDKVGEMSSGEFKPKIIIRTGIGSVNPLNPQSQHVGDFTDALRLMCSTVEIIRLEEPEEIFVAYEKPTTETTVSRQYAWSTGTTLMRNNSTLKRCIGAW